MSAFPSITPASRRYTPGNYPQKSYRSLSGVVARRTYGNTPFGSRLELEYRNVPDATVTALLGHYHNQTALNQRFRLSSNITAGMSTALADETTSLSANRGNLRWEYEQPPQVDSVRPGVYNVSINLAGEMRDSTTDDA